MLQDERMADAVVELLAIKLFEHSKEQVVFDGNSWLNTTRQTRELYRGVASGYYVFERFLEMENTK